MITYKEYGTGYMYELNQTSWILYYPVIPDPKIHIAQEEYNKLWLSHPEEYPEWIMYGKPVKTPRWTCIYDYDPFEESYITRLISWCNVLAKNSWNLDNPFNGAVVNWYKDGNHYIGAHSDKETILKKDTPILSFSYGATRNFKVTARKDNPDKNFVPLTFQLPNNSLIVMGGQTQKYFKHEVLKDKYLKESRINITVRMFN